MANLMETTPDVLQRQREKFENPNPIARKLLEGFNTAFTDLVRKTNASQSFEVGCGEGELLKILAAENANPYGIDINKEELEHARELLEGTAGFRGAEYGDLYKLTKADSCELVVCCEVIEHVSEPERALDILVELADPWLLLSVPREPIWRALNMARGKYWSDLGNTPSHINHWSTTGFKKLVAERIPIVEIKKPLPWTMILAKKQ